MQRYQLHKRRTPVQTQRILQARLSRRIAALKLSWKLSDGHCPVTSECTMAETVCPAKTNSTLGSSTRVGSLCQDLSNSALSTGLLSLAMNLCITKTSLVRCHLMPAHAVGPRLRRLCNWNLPAEQKKVVTAKGAPVGLKKPVEGHLHGVSGVCPSKFDRSAMWAAIRVEPYRSADHGATSAATAPAAVAPARSGDGVE
jgi:hypothetical protein